MPSSQTSYMTASDGMVGGLIVLISKLVVVKQFEDSSISLAHTICVKGPGLL